MNHSINNIAKYFEITKELLSKIQTTCIKGSVCEFHKAIEDSIDLIIKQADSGGKILFIGNGASASFASHMAVDFWKNAGIKALSFNDSSLLTCIGNDYGYEHVFEKPIEVFGKAEDVLVAISSSGASENILRAAAMAKKKQMKILTLSGFDEKNPLRKLGDINFYVPSKEYGYVEIVHLAICHCIVDMIAKSKNG